MFDLTTIQLHNELHIRQEIHRRLNLPHEKPTMDSLIASIKDIAEVKYQDPIDVLNGLSFLPTK
jgi:hypothetical protein